MGGIVDLIFGKDDPVPQPDPAIGQAALKNAELASEMAGVAREQLAEGKRQYEEVKPFIFRAMEQQTRIADESEKRANEQWGEYLKTYQPIERRVAEEAMAEGSPEQQESEAARARAGVAGAHEGVRAATGRELARTGINPSSGKFGDFTLQSGLAQASDEAGAMNRARTDARLRGVALRSGVAQFGRWMPQTGIASDTLALQGGSSAAAGGGNAIAARNATVGSALPWYGGAMSGNQSAGNMFLGQFGAEMQGYNAQQQAQAGLYQGLGTIGGMILSGPKPWWLKPNAPAIPAATGGIIRRHGIGTGRYRIARRGYQAGGIVNGPGTETSDSVPAMVDGAQPAALSTGEGVLNAEAVKVVGADFIHRMNRIGVTARALASRGITINGGARRGPAPA